MPDDGHDRPLGERVAGVEQRVSTIETEVARHRERLHKIEKDRSAIQMLTRHVGEVTQTVKDLAASIETIAAHAAEHAVEALLSTREKERRSSWDYRLKFLGIALAAGGLFWAVFWATLNGGTP